MFMFPHLAAARRDHLPRPQPTTWSAPGTCGEFVQGRLDGADFLINSPIDRFSRATISLAASAGANVARDPLRSKVRDALEKLAQTVAVPHDYEVRISSDLPHGKGMASSTADLVAAIGATLAQAEEIWSVDAIASFLVKIEPSDCVHVPGVGHVGHLCGTVFANYPAPTGMRVLVLDCGGVIDTATFDRRHAHHVYGRYEPLLRYALTLATRSLTRGCNQGLAQAATMSAWLNQQILPKPPFEEVLRIARLHGALGVNCAHSGSVLGLLYEPAAGIGDRLRQAVENALGTDIAFVGDHRFISGGIYVE